MESDKILPDHLHDWDDRVRVYAYGGDSEVSFEELYQAFKARFARELASQTAAPAGAGGGE